MPNSTMRLALRRSISNPCLPAHSLPGGKSVLDPAQRRLQLGKVSEQDGQHIVVVDPVETNLRVYLWGEVRSEEPVTVQPPRCHENKDAEGSIAEPEPLRPGLCEHANYEVYPVDVIVINAPHLLRPDRVIG